MAFFELINWKLMIFHELRPLKNGDYRPTNWPNIWGETDTCREKQCLSVCLSGVDTTRCRVSWQEDATKTFRWIDKCHMKASRTMWNPRAGELSGDIRMLAGFCRLFLHQAHKAFKESWDRHTHCAGAGKVRTDSFFGPRATNTAAWEH